MISYVKVKRTITTGDNPGTKYLARIWREKMVEYDEVCEQISLQSTASKADVKAVLQALIEVMKFNLLRGASIRLDGFGIFQPALTAEAQDTLEAVTPETIRKAYINFRPYAKFSKDMKGVQFEERDLQVKGIQFPTTNTQESGA